MRNHQEIADGLEPELRRERVTDLESLRSEWTELARQGTNLFGTYEWMSTWWRHWGHDRPLLVTACRRDVGSLAAILPLYRSTGRPLRIVRFLGHGAGDHLGPVCAPGDRAAVARALTATLRQDLGGWDLLLADRLPADEGWAPQIGGTLLRQESSPRIRIEGRTWEEYLSSRSSNFRQQLRRFERRLARDHGFSYRLADDPQRLDEDLGALFRLHHARWGGEGSLAFAPDRQAFHREFAALALERGWLRLWMLEVDREPVAAFYGFRFADIEWYYQAGRDPRWERLSVGLVLLAHSVRAAMDDGMREYRFLRGGETYKDRFTSDVPLLDTVALSNSVTGRAAVLAAAAALAVPASRRRGLVRFARRVITAARS
jgi:CelD/BcsL family acetyltransferase involved in cellulose biosynthesis